MDKTLSRFPYLSICLLLAPHGLFQPCVVIPTKRSLFPSVIKPHFDSMATLGMVLARKHQSRWPTHVKGPFVICDRFLRNTPRHTWLELELYDRLMNSELRKQRQKRETSIHSQISDIIVYLCEQAGAVHHCVWRVRVPFFSPQALGWGPMESKQDI